MTDRELLEWAAKAAGISVTTWDGHSGTQCAIDDVRHGRMWMPLTDDGDALRLAVKLFLWEAVRDGYQHVDSDNDFYAATRRAIVRAAAAIGQSMETQSEKTQGSGRHWTKCL